MTEHAYELPPDDTAPADAVREAAACEVVYLSRNGAPIAAVVAAEAAGYLEALEDAADVIAARRYALQFRPAALRQLRKLPREALKRIQTATEALRNLRRLTAWPGLAGSVAPGGGSTATSRE
jgi:hypothetical protein